MQLRFVKTSAGQAEIQAKALPLSRPVRNLLLVINDSQPASYWLESVKGITEADLDMLMIEGLIAPTEASMSASGAGTRSAAAPAPAAAPAAAPRAATAEIDWPEVLKTIEETPYAKLYDALTSTGKSLLGLMRGYRFVLEVEKCSGAAELQALGLKFVEQLREEQGLSAVRKFMDAVRKT